MLPNDEYGELIFGSRSRLAKCARSPHPLTGLSRRYHAFFVCARMINMDRFRKLTT
jgi:hypothetical protein